MSTPKQNLSLHAIGQSVTECAMLLKAPCILTMTGDVIEHGAVRTDGAVIAEVGTGVKATKADATMKLDNHILLPGFVNAHCHLDLSYCAGKLPPPTSFGHWVAELVTTRQNATTAMIADGLRAALQQCYRSGITCVGDHVGHLAILPFLLQMPLRGRAFLEVVGPTEERGRNALAATREAVKKYARDAKRMTLCPTPHAGYSVHPTILHELLTTTTDDSPLSLHCAESPDEWTCFTQCRGDLHAFATGRGLPLTTPSRSPVDYIARHGGLPPRGLFVHANYLDDADIAALADANVTVVHCPQSHRYFGDGPFPLAKLRAAGISVVLGTDSLASVPSINLLREMQLMKETFATLTPSEIISMTTVQAARALGLGGTCGAIAPGMAADLIAVPIVDTACDPYENILRNSEVPFVVIDGRIVRNTTKGEHTH